MTVILRAFLVIGVLTYFAAKQSPGKPPGAERGDGARVETTTLTAAWNGLSGGAREQIVREGSAEIARRLSTVKLSQDTLSPNDRRPAWRGTVE